MEGEDKGAFKMCAVFAHTHTPTQEKVRPLTHVVLENSW
jgi:hypothetical protein